MANLIQNFLGYLKLNDEDDLDDYDEYEEEMNQRQERSERADRERQRAERRAAKAARKRARYEEEEEEEEIPVSRSRSSRYAREDFSSENTSRYSSRQTQQPASSRYDSRRTAGRSRYEEEEIPVRSVNPGMSAGNAQQQASRSRGTRMERTATNKVVPIRTTSRGLEVCIIKPTAFEDAQDVCDMLLSNRAVILNLESVDQSEAQRIIDFVCGCVYAINGKLHSVARYIFIFSPATVDISGDFAEFFQEAGFGVPKFNKDF